MPTPGPVAGCTTIDAGDYPWDAEHVSRIVVDNRQSITADDENGCEICWEIARQIADVDSGVVTAEEYKRLKAAVGRCTHGAPDYAKSIFLEVSSNE